MVDRVYPVAAVTGAPSYDGRALRQTAVAPFLAGATPTRPLGARSGVRLGTSTTTTVSATSTTWTVNPHAGVIDAEAAAEAGPYAYSFDAVKTGTMTAASGSFARIDLISVQISDPAESDGSSTPSAAIVYTPGTAAAPALPTQPPRSMVIAQINVPISGGGSPSVTWVAPSLTAAGGITPATSAAFGSGTYVGQYIDDPGSGLLLRWNGTAWIAVGPTGGGSAFRVISSNNTLTNQTTFGALPVAADQNAATVTYTKKASSTKLFVRIFITVELTSGVSQLVLAGASLNGGAYTLVAQSMFAQATSRGTLVGEIGFTGVAAGTVTIAPGLATTTGSVLTLYANVDTVSVVASELP